jgi:archaellum component FlaC
MADDKRLERIEDKIDDLSTHLSSIDQTLAGQHESLKHHVRRTDLLEAQVQPIMTHMAELKGVVRLFKFVSVIIAILEGLRHFFHNI